MRLARRILPSVAKIDIISSSAEERERAHFPWHEPTPADGGYNAWQVDAAAAKVTLLHMEMRHAERRQEDFVVLPRRWVVELTFSCPGLDPGRLRAKDCGNLAETLGAFVALASIQLALRRLARA